VRKTLYVSMRHRRTLLITVISPLLFLSPKVYLDELEEAWTDQHILERVWKSLMTKMLGEWGDLILWSTVMLSVNVGLLAIPGVVTATGNSVVITTPEQISSCLSIISSVGSIVVGLLLIRHHRIKREEDPEGASRYLKQNDHNFFGLEPMAIVFSLPWALLMWAMSFFSVALLLFCVRHANLQIRIPAALVSTLFVIGPVTWCIWNSYRSSRGEEDDINSAM